MPSCVVKWCKNHSDHHTKSHNITFHVFPQEPNRKKCWIKAVQLERRERNWRPSKTSKICSIHFKDDDFHISKKGFRMLNKGVVPICTMVNNMGELDEYEAIGSTEQMQITPGCDPLRLEYQSDRKHPNMEQQRIVFIEKDVDDASTVTECKKDKEESGVTSCESSVKAAMKSEPLDPDLQQCGRCNGTIYEFVFVCVQCNVRVCGACDAQGRHALHYVLRAPSGRSECELELVVKKVREALSSTDLVTATDLSEYVPDVDSRADLSDHPPDPDTGTVTETLGDTEYEVVKMEIKTEEEEFQEMAAYPQPTPAENQSLTWDAYGVAEGTSYLAQHEEEAISPTSSHTLTASDSSHLSSSDSDETESLTPINIAQRKIYWTDHMNRQLILLYMAVTKTETQRSRIYSRLKHAFALKFPKIKVTKSQLQEQRKVILKKKLLSDLDLLSIKYELPYVNLHEMNDNPVAKETSIKGQRLEVSKVTSGSQNESHDRTSRGSKLSMPHTSRKVTVLNPRRTYSQENEHKRFSDIKMKFLRIVDARRVKQLKQGKGKSLPPASSRT